MKPPYLKITYDNGFGDVTKTKTTLKGNSIEYLMDAIESALLGIGFTQDNIDEYFNPDFFNKEKDEPETD